MPFSVLIQGITIALSLILICGTLVTLVKIIYVVLLCLNIIYDFIYLFCFWVILVINVISYIQFSFRSSVGYYHIFRPRDISPRKIYY